MKKKIERDKPLPEVKFKTVENMADKMKGSRTILLASMKNLPASQFQKIKKKLRGKAEIFVAKKSIVLRAISKIEKGAVQNLKGRISADTALIFSKIEPFELASLLMDYQTPAKAKSGDVAPDDITVEQGPTDLMPGPAISELGSVGLKVAVEGGKLAIRERVTLVKKGEKINEKIAGVFGKLRIEPMKVGFVPIAAHDSQEDIFYSEIKIDKKGALESLQQAITKSFGFAVNIGYTVKETISYFIFKSGREENLLERIIVERSAQGDKQ